MDSFFPRVFDSSGINYMLMGKYFALLYVNVIISNKLAGIMLKYLLPTMKQLQALASQWPATLSKGN